MPFMDYWDAVDEAMVKLFGIDTTDAAMEPDLIAAAQEEGQTPKDFALWCGKMFQGFVA
jgi:hypothetical protein